LTDVSQKLHFNPQSNAWPQDSRRIANFEIF
jgi:hypothetical protein